MLLGEWVIHVISQGHGYCLCVAGTLVIYYYSQKCLIKFSLGHNFIIQSQWLLSKDLQLQQRHWNSLRVSNSPHSNFCRIKGLMSCHLKKMFYLALTFLMISGTLIKQDGKTSYARYWILKRSPYLCKLHNLLSPITYSKDDHIAFSKAKHDLTKSPYSLNPYVIENKAGNKMLPA